MITITWKAWSGKGTTAKFLAKKLWYKHISIGQIKRDLAKKMEITLPEFDKLGDQPGNEKEFDLKYEEYQKSLKPTDPIILDSRLWFYCQPDSFKIFLDVDINEAAKRIFNAHRDSEKAYQSIETAIEVTKKRNESSRQRYIKLYNIDFFDPKQYDFYLDTTNLSPEEQNQAVLEAYKARKN